MPIGLEVAHLLEKGIQVILLSAGGPFRGHLTRIKKTPSPAIAFAGEGIEFLKINALFRPVFSTGNKLGFPLPLVLKDLVPQPHGEDFFQHPLGRAVTFRR